MIGDRAAASYVRVRAGSGRRTLEQRRLREIQLAVDLGARCNEEGGLIVDARQQTSIQNLYAAGDVVSDLHQIAVATGHAAIAATAIHNTLAPNFR